MSATRFLLALSLLAPSAALAETETIELANGDKVTGTVVERTETEVVLEHDLFGRVKIPVEELKQPEPPNPGLFGTGFLLGWTRTASLGISGKEGTSDTTDVIAALDGDFEDESRRWYFDARYDLSTAEGDRTDHSAMVALGRDWLFPSSRWFLFARSRFDYDEFRTWETRLQGDTGVGYDFIERESFDLRGRTGPSVAQEWHADEFRAEWFAGPELVWRVYDGLKLEASNFFYYSITPETEYRNVSDLHLKWSLMEDPALSMNAGLENEYQSDAESDAEKNELKYYTTIGVDF